MRRLTVCVLFSLLFSTAWVFANPEKELMRLSGTVEKRPAAGASWSMVFSSAPVADSEWIRTHEASLAKLKFQNGRQVATLYERTVVQVNNVSPDKVSLSQFLGKIRVAIKHYLGRSAPVEVTTPSAVMAVRGSVADCTVLPDKTTLISVAEDMATVTAGGKTIDIPEGRSVVIYPGHGPELLPPGVPGFPDGSGHYIELEMNPVEDLYGMEDFATFVEGDNLAMDSMGYEFSNGYSWEMQFSQQTAHSSTSVSASIEAPPASGSATVELPSAPGGSVSTTLPEVPATLPEVPSGSLPAALPAGTTTLDPLTLYSLPDLGAVTPVVTTDLTSGIGTNLTTMTAPSTTLITFGLVDFTTLHFNPIPPNAAPQVFSVNGIAWGQSYPLGSFPSTGSSLVSSGTMSFTPFVGVSGPVTGHFLTTISGSSFALIPEPISGTLDGALDNGIGTLTVTIGTPTTAIGVGSGLQTSVTNQLP